MTLEQMNRFLNSPGQITSTTWHPRRVPTLMVRLALYEEDCARLIGMGAPVDEYCGYAPYLSNWLNSRQVEPSWSEVRQAMQPMIDSFELIEETGERIRVVDYKRVMSLAGAITRLWNGVEPRPTIQTLYEFVALQSEAINTLRPDLPGLGWRRLRVTLLMQN